MKTYKFKKIKHKIIIKKSGDYWKCGRKGKSIFLYDCGFPPHLKIALTKKEVEEEKSIILKKILKREAK